MMKYMSLVLHECINDQTDDHFPLVDKPPGQVGGIRQNSQVVVPLSFTFTLASYVAFSFHFGESKLQMKCFAQGTTETNIRVANA